MTQSPRIVNKPGEKNITQSMLMLLFTSMAQIGIGLFHNCYQDATSREALKKMPFLCAFVFCYGAFPFSLTLFSETPEQPYEPYKAVLMDSSYVCVSFASNVLSYLKTRLCQNKKQALDSGNPQGGEEAGKKTGVVTSLLP